MRAITGIIVKDLSAVRCNQCESTNYYTNITGVHVCRKCGNKFRDRTLPSGRVKVQTIEEPVKETG